MGRLGALKRDIAEGERKYEGGGTILLTWSEVMNGLSLVAEVKPVVRV